MQGGDGRPHSQTSKRSARQVWASKTRRWPRNSAGMRLKVCRTMESPQNTTVVLARQLSTCGRSEEQVCHLSDIMQARLDS
jgi:hypothetical protein